MSQPVTRMRARRQAPRYAGLPDMVRSRSAHPG